MMKMSSRSNLRCPICEKRGWDNIKTEHAFVHCPAFKAIVCMSHCEICKYHNSDVSISWCDYKAKGVKKVGAPAKVRYDTRLSSSEKLLYAEITSLAQKDGYCFANNAYFAKLYGVSKSTVTRWISNLQKQGYVKIDLVKDSKGAIEMRRIIIIDSLDLYSKMIGGYTQNPQEGIRKNAYYNNININNTSINNIPPISPKGDDDVEELFNRFWQAYPKHKAKQTALKAFKKLNVDESLLEIMLKAIEQQKQSPQWQRDNGQYIPYPATWLNQRRWEDETDKPEPEEPEDNTPPYLTRYL